MKEWLNEKISNITNSLKRKQEEKEEKKQARKKAGNAFKPGQILYSSWGSIINGHNMRWRVEGATIAKATDCTISVSGAEYGTKNWEGSCSGLYAHGESYEELFEYFRTNGKIQVEFSDNIITHYKWTGTALITSMEQNASNNEDVTFSVSWKGDGALVLAAIVP